MAVLATLVFCAAPAQGTFPGGNGKIVYENGGNLFTINPDGTGQTQLTATGNAHDPAWSPDGMKIAFDRSVGGNVDVWVMNADGSGLTQLTNDPAADFSPAWSPDGAQLAFVAARDGNNEIYRMKTDGTDQVRITNSGPADTQPDWSPDGSRIAAVSGGIYTMKPDGTDQQFLTSGTGPSWNPESYRLAYTYANPGNFGDIWTIHADGTGSMQVTHNNTAVFGSSQPVWSPDGGQIAGLQVACGDTCGPTHLFVMNADGSNMTVFPVVASRPDWQRLPQPPYVRPRGASPFLAYFDVAYRECTAPNRTHGAPLAFLSCAPPVQTSPNVTAGTPDANGAAPNFRASAILKVLPGNPATQADEADVRVTVSLTDIRCTASTIACTGGEFSDYTGAMRLVLPLSLTDSYVPGLPATSAGSISVPVPCAPTSDATIGSLCTSVTTVDSVIPGAVREGNRAIWELGQLQVWDGGQDGSLASPDDDALFAVQGLFVP
jgi:WD40-like Beta Propeller Repeat